MDAETDDEVIRPDGGSYRSTFDLPGGCEVGRAVFEDDRDPVGSDESDSDARIKAWSYINWNWEVTPWAWQFC